LQNPDLRRFQAFLALIALPALTSCATLHHVQYGDVAGHNNVASHPIDIKVSEVGVDMDEATAAAKMLTRNEKTRQSLDDLNALIGLFQMGPRTGLAVFDDTYARNLFHSIYKECPTGRVTNLAVLRETRKYPVISGEIVRVTGRCLVGRSDPEPSAPPKSSPVKTPASKPPQNARS
jgi:hypothetical protein